MNIEQINIHNFKSLKNVSMQCRNLTVITGLNSSGKSSLLQALFILRAAYLRNRNLLPNAAAIIPFESPETGTIGAFQDLLNYDYEGAGVISMTVSFPGNGQFSFETVPYQSDNKTDRHVLGNVNAQIDTEGLPALFSNNLQYLSALRIGPSDLYPSPPRSDERQIGKDGRFAAYILERHGIFSRVHPSMCLPVDTNGAAHGDLLSRQIDAWLAYITSNSNISIKVKETSTSEVELSYIFTDVQGLPYPRGTKPVNVGFGVSYIFPVLVALLSAQRGDLVIIENPESDLHAKAQSRLGELMALTASTGVQVIVETHSEHIINGIRLQVKAFKDSQKKNGLSSEKIAIQYFTRNNRGETYLIEASLNPDANLSIATGVSGFFDQLDEDLLKIL
jgi:predicted ATPase